MDLMISKVMKNLIRNNIGCIFVESIAGVVPLMQVLIEKGSTVQSGGSLSLVESGVTQLMKSGMYNFLEHKHSSSIVEERVNGPLRDCCCDIYLCSCNALTEDGELYFVDGGGNRVASVLYGGKRVILIVGSNKIVRDLEGAILRVKTIVAPKVAARNGFRTYCTYNGRCISIDFGKTGMADGCRSADRICSDYVVISRQNDRNKNRITVILVGASLGY